MSKNMQKASGLEERFAAIQAHAMQEAAEMRERLSEPGLRVLGVSGSARDRLDMAQEDSSSEWLLMKCLDEMKMQSAETKLLKLRALDIRPCKSCYSTTNVQCHFKCSCYPEGERGDDMTNKVYDLMTWADAVIFATPVNNFKMSSHMALFIDRLISMDGSLMPADPKDPKNVELNKQHTAWIEKHAGSEPGSGFLRRMAGKTAGIIVTGHEAGASLTISSLFMTLNHYGFVFSPFSNMYAMNTIAESTDKDAHIQRSRVYEAEARMLGRNVLRATRLAKQMGEDAWEYETAIN
ncbi:MAG: flavodoxin family protein [Patescibacteria group bacterium]